ncbi:MAG: NAD(P)(+) transhydrogenase (Re/Si-specific) subunit beta [Polyangiaceae bacterium]
MMILSLERLAYIAAALLFILSLRGLSAQTTARRGNLYGTLGMLLAVAMTVVALLSPAPSVAAAPTSGVALLAAAVGIGTAVGALLAARVAMTSMPELVAILHSFVGAAAVLVGIANYLEPTREVDTVREVEVVVGVFIGAVTFTGSVVAFGKLRGTFGSRPLLLPGRHALNAGLLVGCAALAVTFLRAAVPDGLGSLVGIAVIASLLGVHLVAAIGGGDMPVVVSLLNSYSGWAAAAAGFMLSNDLLIITGALVGSSGAILSTIMCRAMNRSIWNVVFGGFGATPAAGAPRSDRAALPVHEASVEQVADLLRAARSVIIVPGYGMAVAQAQHPVRELTTILTERGARVRYAIHPVAGRLPGHMNVLLAEANVPYDIVQEMDEINADFSSTDVAMIIGANDIVNPSALSDPSSPIYGMPVLEAWKAAKVVMLKRGMSAGYAGVDNTICYNENTLMLFGDAKKSVGALVTSLR